MTRRGFRRWIAHAFAAFGVAALLLQSYQAVWNTAILPGNEWVVVSVVGSAAAAYGLLRVRPRGQVQRRLQYPDCRIRIIPGDLFDQSDAHLVIGFTDMFDTDTTDDRVISRDSVQGQFQERIYHHDRVRLDADLTAALANVTDTTTVARAVKPHGKLTRFPVGTVAVLGAPRRYYFCLAYSVMAAELVAQSSDDDLWRSLSCLWSAVHRYAQRGRLAMPVIGTGLARVDTLGRAALIKMILLSFVSASRRRTVVGDLVIVVPPSQFHELDWIEIDDFLRSL